MVVNGKPFVAPPEVQQASIWNDALSRTLLAFFLLLLTLAVHGAGVALWHAIGGTFRASVPLPSWLLFPGEPLLNQYSTAVQLRGFALRAACVLG